MPTPEENKKLELLVEKKTMIYRFLLLGSLSILFLITFVYYLPLRFQQAAMQGDGHGDDHIAVQDDHGEHAGHTELPSISTLERLPLRTPASRVDQLAFTTDQQGVKEFRLEASEFRWAYEEGSWVHVWGYNGQIPGPEIRVSEGDRVRVIVKNSLPDATTIHWHGIDVNWEADGVPNITQDPIESGDEFIYEFIAKPAGTRFYHTHGKSHITSSQQMDMGLSGAFIIESKERILEYDAEHTLILDEWEIATGGANPAVGHVHGAAAEGAIPDFNTFTINGNIFPYIDTIKVSEGERVLLRFINAGTGAVHPMHLHGHSFEVVARDGHPIAELAQERRNTVTVHPGETVDILVLADNPGPWLLHCHHVHHASAGMIMLFQYEGVEPVKSLDEIKALIQ